MTEITPVDKFGKFIIENLRDKGIDFAEGLLKKRWKTPGFDIMMPENAWFTNIY